MFLNHAVLQDSDLGVKMSYNCDWKNQIEETVGKANRMTSWMDLRVCSYQYI